jgi:hypothetical protein
MQFVGESEQEREGSFTFDGLLLRQEESIFKCSVIYKEILRLMVRHHQSQESNEPNFFTIKTVMVSWADPSKAFMHVFVNTTDIQRLEKIKVTNK